MAKLPEIQKSQIDFNGVMDLAQNAIMSRLNCHNVGRILEFDPLAQTCTVELMQVKQFNEMAYIPAPITQVPLIILGAGGGHITMPNPVGTTCVLLFMDRNIDNFIQTGERYVPESTRMHDFTDCIALTTFKTSVNPIEDYDNEAITIINNEIIEEIKNQSYIKVYPDSITLKTEIEQEDPAGSEINLTDKINIQNTQQNLAALIQNFISACESITTVNGGALTPASKQLFTNLKSQFEELLQ